MSNNRVIADLAQTLSTSSGGSIKVSSGSLVSDTLNDSDYGGVAVSGFTDSSEVATVITTGYISQQTGKAASTAGVKAYLQGSLGTSFNPLASATYNIGDSASPIDEIILDSSASIYFGGLSMTALLMGGTSVNVLTPTVVQNDGSITTTAAYSGTNGYYANSVSNPDTRLMYTIPVADWNSWDVAEIEFYTKILSQDSFPSLVDVIGGDTLNMRSYIRANRNGVYAAGISGTYNNDNTGWCTWSDWNKITIRIDMSQQTNNSTILVNDVVKMTGTAPQTWTGYDNSTDVYLSFFQLITEASGDNGVEAYIDEIYIKGYTNGSVTQQFYQGF